MPSLLLQSLLEVGEKMLIALDSGDFDRYHALLGERGTLVDTLSTYTHPSEIDANWEETAAALSDQNEALRAAAKAHQERMQDAITRLEQVKGAQRSYRQAPARSNILNENLRV